MQQNMQQNVDIDRHPLDQATASLRTPIAGSLSQDEGRKRVLAIVAGILVARHLKAADDLFDSKPSPRTESMVAAAVPVGCVTLIAFLAMHNDLG